MKVILLQDVAKIGRRFEVVEVPDGYALNKLIPARQAQPATSENLKRVKAYSDKHAEAEADMASAFATAVAALKEKSVTVTVEANEEGKMFEALKPTKVADAVKADVGVELHESWFNIPTPIKTTGEHTILLSLGEAQGEFTVNVTK